MAWKTISGRDYLYELRDRAGNGRSLGVRSEETEALHASYREHKETLKRRREGAAAQLQQNGRLWRALRLPMMASEPAPILREADRRRMLGSQLLVVGTNAVLAYALEAGGGIAGLADETRDFDMAWVAREPVESDRPVADLLKAVDPTFTMNTERNFQARNSKAYEVELLAAPSVMASLPRRDMPRPIPLPEQEWLLWGRFVESFLVARDGSAVRMVVPDPRWFALHKLWLSRQGKRDTLKRGKDARQGEILLAVARDALPLHPLDAEWEAQIPEELRPDWDAWKAKGL
ncbi:nucleotidyltransferase domain-containing protein [Roseococcus sp. MDT2-1-1]|uniref:Nucleotidyltransferase domain-containing protein n=2 Tax=Sabulicella glaciei TaxID=2984948 RepID=A0ABT3P1Y9_9PROT|nr:nucleotidyltransferase domain-containing protein [Roseococcus sp. MDT2-1-1]